MGYLLINYKGVNMLVTFRIHKQSHLNTTVVFKNKQRAKWYLDNRTLHKIGLNHYEYNVQSESQMNEAIFSIKAYDRGVKL